MAPFTAGMGNIFMQFLPNTQPYYLGCHSLDEITQAQGDLNLIWCKDPSQPNKFKVAGSYRDAPEAPSFTIVAVVQDTIDYLEQITSEVTILVNQTKAGRQNNFANWNRTTILTGGSITSLKEAGVATRTPDDNTEATKEFEISAEAWFTLYPIAPVRQSTTEVNKVNCLRASPGDPTNDLFAACNPTALATANVLKTINGGGAWAATATDPHAADEANVSLAVFPVGATGTRVLVARGPSAPAGAAMEVAYSDDGGATWTVVVVGSTLNQGANWGNALFALDQFHIWLVTTGGYIYFSADGGASWTTQDAGVTTSQDLNAVHFYDEQHGIAGGENGVILTTEDGGGTWSLKSTTGTTDVVFSVFRIDENRAWAGVDKTAGDHNLFYTEDNATTWTARAYSGSTAGQVNGIAFDPESSGQTGFIITDNGSPVGTVNRTRDGGYSWEAASTPTNAGLNSLELITENEFFAAGNASGGTAVILHGVPSGAV